MRADFSNESEGSDFADVVLGLVVIVGVAGAGYMIFNAIMDTTEPPAGTNQPKQPATASQQPASQPQQPPAPLQVQISTPLNKAPNSTILWLQKYLNRQILAPKIGTKFGDSITINFIEENGVWNVDNNSMFLIALWLFTDKYNREGIDFSTEIGGAHTLKSLFGYVGLDVAAEVLNTQKVAGALPTATTAPQKSDVPTYSLPDVDTPIKSLKSGTIRWIQKFLNLMTAKDGAPLSVDGKLGKLTLAKLGNYLAKNHFVFAINYDPLASVPESFTNYSLRKLMGSSGVAQQYFSVAL